MSAATSATDGSRSAGQDRSWMARAACRSVDPELFFPVAESGTAYAAQVESAKRVCAPCPVRQHCLEFALRALPDGIAGGLTPAERRVLHGGVSRRSAAVELIGGTRSEVTAAGRAAIAAGATAAQAAAQFGVTLRTATRWAAEVRAAELPVGDTDERSGKRGVA